MCNLLVDSTPLNARLLPPPSLPSPSPLPFPFLRLSPPSRVPAPSLPSECLCSTLLTQFRSAQCIQSETGEKEDRTKKKTRIRSSEEGDGGRTEGGRGREWGRYRRNEMENEGRKERGEGKKGKEWTTDRPTDQGREEGRGTHQRGRWEIFNTHFAKTILLLRRRTDETAAMAANGMAFISRQFADPSPHFAFLCKNSNAADKFVARERRRERE